MSIRSIANQPSIKWPNSDETQPSQESELREEVFKVKEEQKDLEINQAYFIGALRSMQAQIDTLRSENAQFSELKGRVGRLEEIMLKSSDLA